ncbi:unnamed protein product, partial [Hapterophycus canaliculatus]
MVTTPTSVKSFMLKLVELLHKLDTSRLHRAEIREDSSWATSGIRCDGSSVMRALGMRPGWRRATAKIEPVGELRKQAEIAVRVLTVFRGAALLLDEVDLILQPLKSELNWPLGVKRPLDFTRARPGSQLGDGLRWQVPFHLLEAFFYYTEGRMVVDLAFQDSRRAKTILETIRVAIDEGCAARLIQKTPHVVLLSRKFYHEKLMPLLAQWVLLWMRQRRLREVQDEVALEYLLKGPTASGDQVKAEVKSKLSDEHIKV